MLSTLRKLRRRDKTISYKGAKKEQTVSGEEVNVGAPPIRGEEGLTPVALDVDLGALQVRIRALAQDGL